MSSAWTALFSNSQKKERTVSVIMNVNDCDEVQRRVWSQTQGGSLRFWGLLKEDIVMFSPGVWSNYRKIAQSNNGGTKSDFCVLKYHSLDSSQLLQFSTHKLKSLQNIELLTAVYYYVIFKYDQTCFKIFQVKICLKMWLSRA